MEFSLYNICKYDPKRMMIIPFIVFILAALLIVSTFMNTGMPITPGIDFIGGTAVTIHTTDTKDQIAAFYAEYPLISIDDGIGNFGYYIKFRQISNEKIMKFNEKTLLKYPDANINQISANFGATLQSQAMIALLLAFIGMAVIVFVAFHRLIPAAIVVFAGMADITITAGAMNIFEIELSLATTAALLMLIGYSVDSNILLTSKVLKRQGKLVDKMISAFHTGFIMTTTTLAAVVSMLIVALIGQIPTLYNIAAVLIIGLICDMIFTWIFNTSALRLYIEKEETKKYLTNNKSKIKRARL
ncbi:MAG TPA: protein translocase subunit SecF [Methanocorpusculum sp.]|nr:protein translocase subunit SecF [Methanocorpusculum sp.]HJK02023.1 protein translocase subunit SecF [Methanocorpusculum sp.]